MLIEVFVAPKIAEAMLEVKRSAAAGCELSPKVGDGGNRKGGISWGA
jgi:hypothetical protein